MDWSIRLADPVSKNYVINGIEQSLELGCAACENERSMMSMRESERLLGLDMEIMREIL